MGLQCPRLGTQVLGTLGRSVPLWERPASGARRESEPTGGRVVALSLFDAKLREADLAAPERIGGSELFLLDERRDSSVLPRE